MLWELHKVSVDKHLTIVIVGKSVEVDDQSLWWLDDLLRLANLDWDPIKLVHRPVSSFDLELLKPCSKFFFINVLLFVHFEEEI